ncbi:MAG: nucleotide-binding protein, partial [Bacteroidota bacterium]|nr:nucleotide-binding protein [Bacteroidota bacterium]
GLEFSGYNAKMQGNYLMWRKNCLDVLLKLGDKGTPFREKITKDENGAYFYQNSAQLILETLKLSLPIAEIDAKKNSASAPAPKAVTQPKVQHHQPAPSKQPIQPAAPVPPKPEPVQSKPEPASFNGIQKEVFVLSSSPTELENQLTTFLKEISIEPVVFHRGGAFDAIAQFCEKHPSVKYAYYLFTADDVHNAMFELGYLAGKIGIGKICIIHKKEDVPPKDIPGISYKEIVVKLEEISFGLIKDLKAAGYTVSI